MACKKMYSKLLTLRSMPPPTCEKKLLNFGYQKDDLRKLYLLPFEITKEVKLSMFQNYIQSTRSLLFKIKKEDSQAALFVQEILPSFIFSLSALRPLSLFWKEFLDWASRMVNLKLSLSIKEIMFGIIHNDSKFCLALI